MVSLQTTVLALAVLGGGEAETVLLDFYADWCGPCRQMDPVVQQLVAMGYPVRKVNVDQYPSVAARYGVDLLPCFLLLIDGEVTDRVVGPTSFSRLEQMCKLAQSYQPASQPGSPWTASSGPEPAAVPILPVRSEPFRSQAVEQAIPRPPDSQPSSDAAPWDQRPAEPARVRTAGTRGPSVDELIAATVRLRIEDADGHSCGSGIIIDARGGEALILTCGHVFRDFNGKGRIEVDLFGPTRGQRLPGDLLTCDLERDIGLLTVRTPGPVTVARVAPPGYRVAKGDRVISVGCNNGDPPTARCTRVTSLNKFLGPPNLQVAGLPAQGRSGGGLFSEDGLVIGVCNAADPSDKEGLYAGLASIHAQLDQARLTDVYRSGSEAAGREAPLVAVAPPSMPERMPRPSNVIKSTDVANDAREDPTALNLAGGPQRLSGQEEAALEEIRRRKAAGAEVICVIRSRSDPEAPSEIIVLDQVSPAFLQQLAAEAAGQPPGSRQLTSLEVPRDKPGIPPSAGPAKRGTSPMGCPPYRHRGDRRVGGGPIGSEWQPHWREPLPNRQAGAAPTPL